MKKGFKGKIWKKGEFIDGFLFIENGKIVSDIKAEIEDVEYIIPPLSDAHIHGGWSYSFQKGDFGELEEKLIKIGIFFAIPTLMNDTLENLKNISEIFQNYKKENPNSIFPFLRVEGPFISGEKSGAQDMSYYTEPSKENIKKFLSIENIKIFTFAPEIENAKYLVKKSLNLGKIPSIGHSNGKFNDFLKVYELGVRHFNHYPNALRGLHHREIGLVGAGFLYPKTQLEVIGDFIHSSLEFIKLVYKIKKSDFSLVSDLIPYHSSDNENLNKLKIIKKDRKITDKNGTLLGGDTPISEQISLFFKAGFNPEDIVKIACINNRKFVNYKISELDIGKEASFIILNKRFEIQKIYFKGKIYVSHS